MTAYSPFGSPDSVRWALHSTYILPSLSFLGAAAKYYLRITADRHPSTVLWRCMPVKAITVDEIHHGACPMLISLKTPYLIIACPAYRGVPHRVLSPAKL